MLQVIDFVMKKDVYNDMGKVALIFAKSGDGSLGRNTT
jgi:hypothetical protein